MPGGGRASARSPAQWGSARLTVRVANQRISLDDQSNGPRPTRQVPRQWQSIHLAVGPWGGRPDGPNCSPALAVFREPAGDGKHSARREAGSGRDPTRASNCEAYAGRTDANTPCPVARSKRSPAAAGLFSAMSNPSMRWACIGPDRRDHDVLGRRFSTRLPCRNVCGAQVRWQNQWALQSTRVVNRVGSKKPP
jgi:hypothetical protein